MRCAAWTDSSSPRCCCWQLLELTVFVLVGQAIGFGLALLLVFGRVRCWAGFLLRREGCGPGGGSAPPYGQGRPPGSAATDGLVVFIGGVLLLACPA